MLPLFPIHSFFLWIRKQFDARGRKIPNWLANRTKTLEEMREDLRENWGPPPPECLDDSKHRLYIGHPHENHV
jgi:hypothetical protein